MMNDQELFLLALYSPRARGYMRSCCFLSYFLAASSCLLIIILFLLCFASRPSHSSSAQSSSKHDIYSSQLARSIVLRGAGGRSARWLLACSAGCLFSNACCDDALLATYCWHAIMHACWLYIATSYVLCCAKSGWLCDAYVYIATMRAGAHYFYALRTHYIICREDAAQLV